MKLRIRGRDGTTKTVDAVEGISAMETIRGAGFDELLALCGGSPACATCHVYVDAEWVERLNEPTRDEQDLLENLNFRTPRSRLSCQIRMTERLDGLAVRIAPEEYGLTTAPIEAVPAEESAAVAAGREK
jgi:ferredoxin, 2Fe-2S